MSRKEKLVALMRQNAFRLPALTAYGTPQDRQVIEASRFAYTDGTVLIFTRDEGMHTSGWWKNPDYERCLHLSLSFRDPRTGEPTGHHDRYLADEWCRLFFRHMCRLIWAEPPFSPEGKVHATWHYRVFMAEDWKTPILPRGEVYTREFTKAGWKSWSDVHAKKREPAHT